MSKIFKKLMATTMAAALAMNSILCMPANAATYEHPNSSSWSLHTDPHDSRISQNLQLVASGNGYYAYITSKSGNCSVNYVTISADYTATRMITEVGESYKILINPTHFDDTYVVFTVHLTAMEGTQSHNGGIIERK